MPTSRHAHVITLEGPDAVAFAHSQFTSDVAALDVGRWQFSAWLDAQGRVRALFHLARPAPEKLLLLLRGGDAHALSDALRRFVFRSRVKLEAFSHLYVNDAKPLALHLIEENDGHIAFGCETHAIVISENASALDEQQWPWLQLQEGWAWLSDSTVDEYLAASLSLHRLDAIALKKGCYPGQEIVARLHFRGGNKRFLTHITISQEMSEGATLRRDKRDFVRLLNVVKHEQVVHALIVTSEENSVFLAENGTFDEHDNAISLTIQQRWNA